MHYMPMKFPSGKISSQYYASIALASVFHREKIKDAPYDGFEEETSILHYGTRILLLFLLPFLIKMKPSNLITISTGKSVLYIFTSIDSIAIILIFTCYNEEIFGFVLVITFLITDKFRRWVQPAEEWFNFSENFVNFYLDTLTFYLIVGLLTNLIDIALANNHNNNLVVGTMCTCIFV
ncbi:hypothetical protein ACJX0J_008633, partial [Zea mays]